MDEVAVREINKALRSLILANLPPLCTVHTKLIGFPALKLKYKIVKIKCPSNTS